MNIETTNRLLNEALELLSIFEESGSADEEIMNRIDAVFNEIKNEMILTLTEREEKK